MIDITVIVLTKNEERHIARCLENVKRFARQVYVVDCYSSDCTRSIACSMGADVIEHEWPGNQAAQFNWALDTLNITTEWIMRLDADEYLTEELIQELEDFAESADDDVSALVFPLGRVFMGRMLKHGIVNGVKMVRMFRRGKARYENRIMDEHLQIIEGSTHTCKHKFVDDNRMPLDYFISKHNKYAEREAIMLVCEEYNLTERSNGVYAAEVNDKRQQKATYNMLPLFWRAFGYFCYRYFIKLGFLDGKEGFLWDFFQGWWYRTLVDAKIFEIKKKCGRDRARIKTTLEREYGVLF